MLSAVILTHNDEMTIERCIKSLKFCDDIIVMDDDSTDGTLRIVKKYPAAIIRHPLEGDFSAQRNRALRQAQEKWVFFVDADEEVPKGLQDEIKSVLKSPKYESYYIKRLDKWWGRGIRHGEVRNASEKGFIRLVSTGSGLWKGKVHEEFHPHNQSGRLHNALIHYPHPGLSEFISEVNNYSTLRSKELYREGHRTNIMQIMTVPFLKFIYTYFLKGGYKDGAAGFVYSFMMSFHSFLVRAKMYQYQHIDS